MTAERSFEAAGATGPDSWNAERPVLGSTLHLAALALAGFALLYSLTSAAAPSRGGQDPASLYHNYCSVCHGDRGDGRSRATASFARPPRDFTAPEAAPLLTVDRMFAVIREGLPGTAMAGWKRQLSDEQIRSLAQYVRDTFVAPASSPVVQRGKAVYAQNCAACHGEQGQGGAVAAGGRPARDFRSPAAATELTRERMLAAVTHGRPGTAMAGFDGRLAKEDLEAVVEYVRVSIMLPAMPGISGTSAHAGRGGPSRVDMDLPFPQRLAGDARKGRAFYLANCATCHGDTGDGKGPRAYFIRPKPRVLIDPNARAQFNRPALYAAIAEGRLGSEMPAWNKVLTPQQIADVGEFVFQAFIRAGDSAPATAAK